MLDFEQASLISKVESVESALVLPFPFFCKLNREKGASDDDIHRKQPVAALGCEARHCYLHFMLCIFQNCYLHSSLLKMFGDFFGCILVEAIDVMGSPCELSF